MNGLEIFLTIILPIMGGITTLFALLSSIFGYKEGKAFHAGFKGIYTNILRSIFDLQNKKIIYTKKTEDKLIEYITKWKLIKYIIWGWSVKCTSYGTVAYNILHKHISRKFIDRTNKYTIKELKIILLFKLKAENILPDLFEDYRSHFDVEFMRTRTSHNLDLVKVKTLYKQFFEEKKKKKRLKIKDIVIGKQQAEHIPDKKYLGILNKFISYIRKLVKELNIDLTSYIKQITESKYNIILLNYKAHIENTKDELRTGLLNNKFSQVGILPLTWMKIVDNKELFLFDNLEAWLINELGSLLDKADDLGGANFFIIKFAIEDLIEKNTGFEDEDYIMKTAIKAQINVNDTLFNSILKTDFDKDFPSLSPVSCFMDPRSFLNCILERNYAEDEYEVLANKIDVEIKSSLNFADVKKNTIIKIFNITVKEYRSIMDAVETLDILTMDLFPLMITCIK
ncbi:MAG: hypothetical protein ACTSSK_03310 [Candidatus Heimdallarchaeota archaeon]